MARGVGRIVLLLLLAPLIALGGGCRGLEAPDVVLHAAPVRAVDVLVAENWPAGSRSTPPSYPPEVILDERFEGNLEGWRVLGSSDPSAAGIDAATDAALEGERSLRIAARSMRPVELPVVVRSLAVASNSTYRIAASYAAHGLAPQGEDSLGAGIELVERDAVGPVAHHRQLPRERGTSPEPRRLGYVFETQRTTRTLDVRLVAAVGPATGGAVFDGLRVERLDVREALYRAAPPVARRGQEVDGRLRAVTIAADRRPSVVATPGVAWTLPVRVDAGVTLRLALGAPAGVAPATRLCFRIAWDEPVGRELFAECLGPDREAAWRDREVDLAGFAGRGGTLRFETEVRADAGAAAIGLGVWGNPRLVRAAPTAGERPPDVVLLVLDTLRADHLGFDGYTSRPTSPRLDALASRSIVYRRAYAPSPWTAPSVGSLFTSRSPHVHGAGQRIPRELRGDPTGNELPARNVLDYRSLSPDLETLAERFRDAGYETAGFHANYFLGAELGFERGFDRYRYYEGVSEEGGRLGAREALEWLADRPAGQPVFLMLHFIDPHMPFRMRPGQLNRFGPALSPASGGEIEESGSVVVRRWYEQRDAGEEDLGRIVAMYDSEIAWMDEALGSVVDRALESEPTVIVALSDHGEAFRDQGWVGHGNTLLDELLRVPLLIRLPHDRDAGRAIDAPVSLLDVAPSLLSAASLAPLADAEGRLLPGFGSPPNEERELFAEAMYLGPDRSALRRGGFKYVFTHPRGPLGFQAWQPEPGTGGDGAPLLFDLDRDPGETRNLAGELPDLAGEMRARVLARLSETEWGLHLHCPAGQRRVLRLDSESTLVELKPLSLESNDRMEVAPARRALTLELGGPDAPDGQRGGLENGDWVVLRFADDGATIRLVGADPAIDGTTDLPGSLPRSPPENLARAGTCVIWAVRRAESPPSLVLDEGQRERLRALGYL